MNNHTPQINLSSDLPGLAGFCRQKTPGDVGDSIFKKVFNDLSNDEESPYGGLNLCSFEDLEKAVNGKGSKGRENGLSFLGGAGASDRLVLPDSEFQKLADFLKKKGLSIKEINQFLLSLTDGDGNIRINRLLAKLNAYLDERKASSQQTVITRDGIPKVQEALFKMGLGAEQVDQVVRRSLNKDGNLLPDRLTNALGEFFTGISPEIKDRFAAILTQRFGVKYQAETHEQITRMAGLDKALSKITGGAPETTQEAVKQEIAALLREKGLQPEKVKRFLETLHVQQKTAQDQGNPSKILNASGRAFSGAESEDPLSRLQLRKDGKDFSTGDWRERIIDILKRENLLGTRETAGLQGRNLGTLAQKFAETQGDLNSGNPFVGKGEGKGIGLLFAKEAQGKNQPVQAKADGKTSMETPGVAAKGAQAKSTSSGVEFSIPRAERISSAERAANIRGAAPATPLPEPLPKVVDRMFWMVRSGEQTSRIQISPPELGRLDLEIVIRQGHLHAHLNAENPLVKEIIEAHLQQLKQQLNNLGFIVEKFDVQAGLDERRFASGQNAPGRNGKRAGGHKGAGREEAVGSVGKAERTAHTVAGDYQIDVHV